MIDHMEPRSSTPPPPVVAAWCRYLVDTRAAFQAAQVGRMPLGMAEHAEVVAWRRLQNELAAIGRPVAALGG